MKNYRFFYHFFKAKNAMTIHFRGKCLVAKNVVCKCPAETKWNENKQPMLVMRGFCKKVTIDEENQVATIE